MHVTYIIIQIAIRQSLKGLGFVSRFSLAVLKVTFQFFVIETQFVFCEVETEFLYRPIIEMNFSIKRVKLLNAEKRRRLVYSA
jgi:hypothetical protein